MWQERNTLFRPVAIALYRQGWGTPAIVKYLGVGSNKQIRRWLTEAGAPLRPVGYRPENQKRKPKSAHTVLPDDVKAEAVARYVNGESSVALAKDYKVGSEVVARWVRNSGNQMRLTTRGTPPA